MNVNEIKTILLKQLPLESVYVSFSDTSNCQIIAVSRIFYNMSTVERHKLIYEPLMQYILNNKIHSVSIRAFDLKEWHAKS